MYIYKFTKFLKGIFQKIILNLIYKKDNSFIARKGMTYLEENLLTRAVKYMLYTFIFRSYIISSLR